MGKTKRQNLKPSVALPSSPNKTVCAANKAVIGIGSPPQKVPVTFPVEVAFRCSSEDIKRAFHAVLESSQK